MIETMRRLTSRYFDPLDIPLPHGHPAPLSRSRSPAPPYMPGKSRVSYFYDADVGNYYYGAGHPMLAHCHCLCSQPDCVIL